MGSMYTDLAAKLLLAKTCTSIAEDDEVARNVSFV